MATHYLAGFSQNKSGGYTVIFPDLPEAFTQGEDLPDAMRMAEDVLKITLEEYAMEGKTPPEPSGHAAAHALMEKELAELGDAERKFFLQPIAVPDMS